MRTVLALLVAVAMVALGSISHAGEDLVALTNADRAAHGLAPLTRASDLQAYAQRKAEDMMRAGELSHSTNLGTAITNWRLLGENVGRGPTLSDIEAGFMASPTHRVNVLHADFTQIGVGVVWDGVDRFYVAVIFRLPKTTTVAPAVAPAAPRPARVAATPPTTARPKPARATPPPTTPTTRTTPTTTVPPPPEPAPVEPAPVEPPAPVVPQAGARLNWVVEATTWNSAPSAPAPAPPVASEARPEPSPELLAAANIEPAGHHGSARALPMALAFFGVLCGWMCVLAKARRTFTVTVRFERRP